MLNDRFRENALHCREPFGSLVEEGLMSSLHQHQAPFSTYLLLAFRKCFTAYEWQVWRNCSTAPDLLASDGYEPFGRRCKVRFLHNAELSVLVG